MRCALQLILKRAAIGCVRQSRATSVCADGSARDAKIVSLLRMRLRRSGAHSGPSNLAAFGVIRTQRHASAAAASDGRHWSAVRRRHRVQFCGIALPDVVVRIVSVSAAAVRDDDNSPNITVSRTQTTANGQPAKPLNSAATRRSVPPSRDDCDKRSSDRIQS